MTQRLADSLLKKGHQVEVIAVESVAALPDEPFCTTEVEGNLTVHRLRLESKFATSPLSLNYCNSPISEWYMEHSRTNRPDVIHLLSGYLITGCILEAAFEHQIPSVITLVDYWFICPRITLVRSDGIVCDHEVAPARCVWCLNSSKRRFRVLDEMFHRIPGNLFTFMGKKGLLDHTRSFGDEIKYIHRRRDFNKNILEIADGVVTHSRFLEQKLFEYGIQPNKVFFIPNGIEVDSDNTLPRPSDKRSEKLRIGYLGQIASHKGVDVLIRAYQMLNPPPGRCELRIYGELHSWPGYVNELRALANGREDIVFAGEFPAQEVARVMAECDVIVVPSVWYENRPTVILEAFANGLPVIASELGGMEEMVEHGVDGFLFKPRDPSSLAEQLGKLLAEPQMLQMLSAGIKPVKNVSEELDELERLYKHVIASRQKAEVS